MDEMVLLTPKAFDFKLVDNVFEGTMMFKSGTEVHVVEKVMKAREGLHIL